MAFREAAGKQALSLAGRSNPDGLHPVQPRQSHGVLTTSCFLILLSGFSSIVNKRAATHKMEGPKLGLKLPDEQSSDSINKDASHFHNSSAFLKAKRDLKLV